MCEVINGDQRLLAVLDDIILKLPNHVDVSMAIDAALYAVAVTFKNPTLRRVFIQDFAAALNRRGIIPTDGERVEEFWKLAEYRINNINAFKRAGITEVEEI